MIRVRIEESIVSGENEFYLSRIRVKGHAGYAAKGQDIVCAGVSALVISFVNGVETLCGKAIDGVVEEGLLDARVPRDPCAQLLAKNLAQALEGISNAHAQYVKVDRMRNGARAGIV